jgi:serine/threonine protein kinase/Tfp pilus assembly protein PilF
MITTRFCPQCQQPLSADAPAGLCPQCLMKAAADPPPSAAGDGLAGDLTDIADPSAVAKKLPQFEILELLGRGGMGVVYKARQKSLNRLVAIKILAPEREHEPHFAKRFAREAELLAKLSHPHIVTIHDFGVADPQLSTTNSQPLYYLVMEFVDGVNLRDLLRDGKLEAKQALAIVPPICEALQYAHDKGIVHRDIKPENLLLDKDGRIKIADFGIAALIGAGGENIGTPPYMAPEQSGDSSEVDSRADIYALGVVLYEMLTGERPGKDLVAPSKKVQIDVRLDEMVLRALEKEPERRYQTAGEFRTVAETMNDTPMVDGLPTQLLKSSESLYATPEFLSAVWGAMKLHQGMGMLLLYSDRLEFQAGLSRTVIPLGSVRRLDLITYPFFQSPAGLRSIEVEFQDAEMSRRLVLTPSKGMFSFVGTTNNRVFEWFGAIREAIQNKTGSPPAGSSSPVPYQSFSASGKLVSALVVMTSFATLFAVLTALALTGSWGNVLLAAVPFFFGASFVLAIAWRQRRQWRKEHSIPECVESKEGQTAQASGGRRTNRMTGAWMAIGCGVLLLGSLLLVVLLSVLIYFWSATNTHEKAGRETQSSRQESSNASQLLQEGWQLWQSGKPAEAQPKFKDAVKLAPGDANAWNGLGWSLFNSGNPIDAEKAFQKAVGLDPKIPGGLNGLGQIYLSQRKYDDAEGYLLASAEQGATAGMFGLARLYLLQGKFELAERWAQRVVESGEADEVATKMLEATKGKNLPEGLRMKIEPPVPPNVERTTPDVGGDKITVEDLALQMIVAIREKNDAKLKSLASDQVKGWPDALPVFAVELREHFRQFTGNESFDLKAGESLVEGDLAAVRCTGPVELNGKCMVLIFVKTKEGWRNHSLRNSTVGSQLEKHLADLKVAIRKQR